MDRVGVLDKRQVFVLVELGRWTAIEMNVHECREMNIHKEKRIFIRGYEYSSGEMLPRVNEYPSWEVNALQGLCSNTGSLE